MNEELTFNSNMALAYDTNTRISIPTYDALFAMVFRNISQIHFPHKEDRTHARVVSVA